MHNKQEVGFIATKPADHRSLSIADVCFRFSTPINVADLPSSFQHFQTETTGQNLICDISCPGSDEALVSLPLAPDAPWSFTVHDGLCEVIRRNQEGAALWRIIAPLSFECATVTWNPLRFPSFYTSYEQAWGTGLGVSLLVLRLRAHGGLVLHGMAAEVDGQGILCVGVSGKGKSTLARLLYATGATVLTDERPILRQRPDPASCPTTPSDSFRIYGSPWPSSAGFAHNAWAPLRRLYFIEHGESDRITPLSAHDAVSRLIHVATIPWQDPALLDPYLATVETLLKVIPCAVLSFRPTSAVADVIRSDLSRSSKELQL